MLDGLYPIHLKKSNSDCEFLAKIHSENDAVSLDTAYILCRDFCSKLLCHSSTSSGGLGIDLLAANSILTKIKIVTGIDNP